MVLDEKRTINDVGRFFTEHDRWPSAVAESDFERSMGVWLNKQRVDDAGGDMDQFRRAFLDHHLPGWKACAEEIWQERAREASDFVLSHARLPELEADEKTERLVAIWLTTQQALARTEILGLRRGAWLDAHCPGWRG